VAGPPGIWDVGRWDANAWVGPTGPPGAGWGAEWRFWYQVGSAQIMDLTDMVVEARWTTDGHTPGDGTLRGDVQPGKCAIRMWDPTNKLGSFDKFGAVWACYIPTGATWAWFYNTFTRGLYAPGDKAAADCVFSGDTWPVRMTANTFTAYGNSGRPAESANARLNDLADKAANSSTWLGDIYSWRMPAIVKAIAAQSQTVPAVPTVNYNTNGQYPSWLALVRDAASDGLMWWGYGRDAAGNGTMTFHYDRWETANAQRVLDPAQVVAGPPVDASAGFVFGYTDANATRGADGVASFVRYNGNPAFAGAGNIAVRMYGDINSATGPEYSATNNTIAGWGADHYSPGERVLSSISCQSGPRWTAAGQASSAHWDPAAHVWGPLDVMSYADPVDSRTHLYRVAASSHVLNAAAWQTAHTLEKYSVAYALP
jgi:hypothetical protein